MTDISPNSPEKEEKTEPYKDGELKAEAPQMQQDPQPLQIPDIKPPSRLVFAFFIVSLSLFFVAMFFINVESVIGGQGTVEAGLGVQSIKSQEGGILDEIYVRKGETVSKGQELALLSNSSIIAKLKEIESELGLLKAKQYRLQQEKSNAENFKWPDELSGVSEAVKAVQKESFYSRTSRASAELEAIRFEIKTLNKELQGAQREIQAIEAERRSVKNILDFKLEGHASGFVGKADVLQAKSQYAQILSEGVRIRAKIPALKSQIAEKKELLQETVFKHKQSVDDELEEVSLRMLILNAEIAAASDQDNRRVLRSPMDAVINDVHVIGSGDIVQPAEPLLDLVPLNSGLTINVKIDPSLRRGLYTGLPAKASFTALQDLRAAPMEGKVNFVAADTQTDQEGNVFYEVHVQTGSAVLALPNGEEAAIEPGMQASVSIIVGEHSLSDFLLRPFEWVLNNAFRER